MPLEQQITQLDHVVRHLLQAKELCAVLAGVFNNQGEKLKKDDIDEVHSLASDAYQIAVELCEVLSLERSDAQVI